VNLRRKLARAMSRAIGDFKMISEGDRIMCAVSGGKDPGHLLRDYMARNGHEFVMIAEDTYSIVTEKIPEGKTYCSLCSRLRRGILYRVAAELGCTKIALGHHRDDAITTLMLNLVFSGQLKAMPPKLVSDDGRNVVIRPLIFCAEDDLAAFAEELAFPILPCDLCGSQENLQRKAISRLLAELDARCPGARRNMLAALANVRPSHLFDRGLWDKLGLEVAREESSEGGSVSSEDDESDSGGIVPLSRLVDRLS
jgi:tRNA 2-thiocytidine biosynthesis protein TtcA